MSRLDGWRYLAPIGGVTVASGGQRLEASVRGPAV
jgi:hypothetical protein